VFNSIPVLNANRDHMFIMNLLQEFNLVMHVIFQIVNNVLITIVIAVIVSMVMQLMRQMENVNLHLFKDVIILLMDIVPNVIKDFYYLKI